MTITLTIPTWLAYTLCALLVADIVSHLTWIYLEHVSKRRDERWPRL